jgi:hypothetical protein
MLVILLKIVIVYFIIALFFYVIIKLINRDKSIRKFQLISFPDWFYAVFWLPILILYIKS